MCEPITLAGAAAAATAAAGGAAAYSTIKANKETSKFQRQQAKQTTPVIKSKPVTAAPTKTDTDIQKETEKDRLRRAYSTKGLPSLVLTGGLGDTSGYSTSGVVLGSS